MNGYFKLLLYVGNINAGIRWKYVKESFVYLTKVESVVEQHVCTTS